MVDMVASHSSPIAARTDTPARIRMAGGGSAANTAAWLAALGVSVRLLAARGDDALGQMVHDELIASGVKPVGPLVAGVATGACIVLVDPSGERTMLPDRGANDHLDVAAVERALVDTPPWLHVSAYTFLHSGSRAAGLAALRAGGPDTIVSVDVASAGPLREMGADAFLDLIDGVDLVLANDDELAVLGGIEVVVDRVGAVVAKHGAAGATWTDGLRRCSTAAVAVAAVDTTGAGDGFAAGWIAARLSGRAPMEALGAAASVGARAVATVGARPPMSPRNVS